LRHALKGFGSQAAAHKLGQAFFNIITNVITV